MKKNFNRRQSMRRLALKGTQKIVYAASFTENDGQTTQELKAACEDAIQRVKAWASGAGFSVTGEVSTDKSDPTGEEGGFALRIDVSIPDSLSDDEVEDICNEASDAMGGDPGYSYESTGFMKEEDL